MKKQVCIRLSEDCIAIIEKQKGENFSQKLENMIYLCNQEIPRVEKDIETATKRLAYLVKSISNANEALGRIRMIDRNLRSVEEILDNLVGEFQ